MTNGRTQLSLAFLLSTFVIASVTGAPSNAQLRGTVRDPAHDALAGASVTITNLETGRRRKCQTDTNGRFVVEAPHGVYKVRVDLFGYISATRDNVTLQARKPQQLDFDLGLAGGESGKSSKPAGN